MVGRADCLDVVEPERPSCCTAVERYDAVTAAKLKIRRAVPVLADFEPECGAGTNGDRRDPREVEVILLRLRVESMARQAATIDTSGRNPVFDLVIGRNIRLGRKREHIPPLRRQCKIAATA